MGWSVLPRCIGRGAKETGMTPEDYSIEAERTASRLTNWLPGDIVHSAMGIASEAGEILDNVKGAMFYGKSLDAGNLKEELGDICWFMDMMMRGIGTTWGEVMSKNITKLRVRYPEQFKTENAVARDLSAEQAVFNQPEQIGEQDNAGYEL